MSDSNIYYKLVRDNLKSHWHNLTNYDISIFSLSYSNDTANKENVNKDNHEDEIN